MRKLSLFLLAATLCAQTVETIPFRAVLSPRNEVPPVTDVEASGNGTFLLHVIRDANGRITSAAAEYRVSYLFPGSVTFTGMHIHRGTAAEAGPVVINSTVSAANPVSSDSTGRGSVISQFQVGSTDTATLDAVNGVIANPSGFYLNLHTAAQPNGVIRGQLQRAEMVVLMGLMSPRNEVPPVNIGASGVATITAVRTLNENGSVSSGNVTFDINYTGFPEGTSFTGLHIHNGPAGVNAGVTINTGIGSGPNSVGANPAGGSLHYEVEINPAMAAQVTSLNALFGNSQSQYVNLHTVESPGGVIRAQLRRTDRMTFPVTLLSSNELPPTGLDATAPSLITIYTIRDEQGNATAGTVIFDVNARFPSAAQFTGLHIHAGNAGSNGQVVIGTDLGAGDRSVNSSTGVVNIYRSVTVSSAAGLTALNAILTAPENFYVNLHTTIHPNGAVRAQLAPASTARPAVTFAGSSVMDASRRQVAPGGLLTIMGTELIRVPGEVGASLAGSIFPNTYNGTSVTIGGKAAPVVVANRTSLVVQVPVDAAIGEQDVVVKTPTGESTAVKVTVNVNAPAIFFTNDGGIFLKNNDFSLVSRTNPARAGDILLVYTTGLGVTTGQNTGQITPTPEGASPTFIDTPAARVTVGGRDARVIYSIASPGFLGLYQTAFVVPEGLTAGPQPVVLTVNNVASNSVMLMVQ